LVAVVFTLVAGCQRAPQKVLLIAPEYSSDLELMLTKEINVMISMLEDAGYEAVLTTVSGKPLQPLSNANLTVVPDLKSADVVLEDYAGFMFPCMGVPFTPPWPPAEHLEMARAAAASGKPIAAQLGGVILLGKAGVLDGKQYALYGEVVGLMPEGIVKSVNGDGVIQDGNIITSGICPLIETMAGMTDGTPELVRQFVAALDAQR
jgi:putative intracellular protease/amidase